MASKTPQFDRALDEYFVKLALDENGGQWRTCRFSGAKFYIRPEDIEFYKRIQVSLPTLSPKERTRRKLAFLNSYNLFKVVSAFSGKEIISQYPPSNPYKVYEHHIWWGDQWSPEQYARRYDSSRSFFEQFRSLQLEVPRPNLHVDKTNTNSDYTNNSGYLKNCYLVFDSFQVEDSVYGIGHLNAKNVFDSFTLQNCDTCYDCFESSDLWRCFYAEYSKNCRECYFLLDCRDCDQCLGCTNLRHKQYYFFNEPLTKEEYERRLRTLDMGDRATVDLLKKRFAELKEKAYYKQTHNERAVDSTGEYLKDVKNGYASFYMVGGENIAYAVGGTGIRNAYDTLGGVDAEYLYDTMGGVKTYGLLFSLNSDYSRNLEYCDLCVNCHDCFGCAGLRNKSFCILNVQYSEEDYWRRVDAIKTVMLRAGEYGEFFPPALALFPYNVSIATSYAGYDDVEIAREFGYPLERIEETAHEAENHMVDASSLPANVKDADDAVLNKIVLDREHGKKFRYIKQELDFYRQYRIPLPLYHPSERLAEKRKRFGPILFSLYNRPCGKCRNVMQTSYSPERREKNIYCEQCYLEEIG